jgi:hypothetical protein
MPRVLRLEPSFVHAIPELIEPGSLYISVEYATVVHSCCCGCGEEVVTPLTPTDWRMTFDGESVSLWPSVGSWTLPCRSHYIVERNAVRWAKAWKQEQIDAERRRDRAAKTAHYAEVGMERKVASSLPTPEPSHVTSPLSRFQKVRDWISMACSTRRLAHDIRRRLTG